MDHRPWKIAISAVLALACALAPVSHAQAPDAPPPTDAAPPTEAPPDTSTPEGSGRIAGRVLARDAKTAVADAVVQVVHLRTGATVTAPPTKADGAFSLEGIPYGYVDVLVTSGEDVFLASQVVNVPPDGKVALILALTRNEELPQGWWSGGAPPAVPGRDRAAAGVAIVQQRARGRDFWTSGKGVAILGGAGALALLALTAGGGGDETPASPSSP